MRFITWLVLLAVLAGLRPAIARDVDPARWAELRVGMPEADVVRLLGAPDRRDHPTKNRTTLIYGEIVAKSEIFPKGLAFVVWLDEKKNINSVETPFGDAAPRAGLPGKPEIFLPAQNSSFDHYPRILDVRWYAVPGTYPMTYEVEYEFGYNSDKADKAKLAWFPKQTSKTRVPFLSLVHEGGQPGRVRVRAKNAKGDGAWSDFAVFEFTR